MRTKEPGRMQSEALLERSFFARDAVVVAPELLNLVLRSGELAGRIVEVEAYHAKDDAASHAFRGPTPRNASMFGPPGHLYVYFTYGMHFCANVVCSKEGEASAVLLRALRPLSGLELMRARRGGTRRDEQLCAGPARLCQALGLTRANDGEDLTTAEGLALYNDGTPPPPRAQVSTRIGLSKRSGEALYYPWRFSVPDDPNVSRRAPGRV